MDTFTALVDLIIETTFSMIVLDIFYAFPSAMPIPYQSYSLYSHYYNQTVIRYNRNIYVQIYYHGEKLPFVLIFLFSQHVGWNQFYPPLCILLVQRVIITRCVSL